MKAKTLFYCTECGNETAKWAGKCPACGASVSAAQPQAPVHDQQSNSYARQSAPSYRPAPGGRVDNLVLAENEKMTGGTNLLHGFGISTGAVLATAITMRETTMRPRKTLLSVLD